MGACLAATGFDPEYLVRHEFAPAVQRWAQNDTILYALGLGLGSRPTDPAQLRFVYEDGLQALPTMAVVLAHPGFWAGDPALGIDWKQMLHVEQGLTLLRPVPIAGSVRGESRIVAVDDRGRDKGAIIHFERRLFDVDDDQPVAIVRQTVLCRGNGGAGSAGDLAERGQRRMIPDRAADVVVEVATLPQAALIYRLSGDRNPLHADPAVAAAAGFEAPILHGLATYGIAGAAILQQLCGSDPARFSAFDARFTAPVIPGDTLRIDIWREQGGAAVRATALERDRVALDNGWAVVT